MFRRRSELLKRVWKFWRGVQTSGSHLENNTELQSQQAKESQAVLYSLLKRLSDSNLKLLYESLESCGKKETGCILFPCEEVRLGRRTVHPHIIFCNAFRWSDLAASETVKSLWICKSSHENSKLCCCNPYHYSRVVPQDCMLPPYPAAESKNYTPKDCQGQARVDSFDSVTPNLEKTKPLLWPADLCESTIEEWPRPSPMPDEVWCQVAYWELVTRVGRLYEVYDNPLSIFLDAPQETGLCLGLLKNNCRTTLTERVRHHIGPGFQITKEIDGIWIYNRSEHTVFASSSTLQLASDQYQVPKLKRVPCGSSLLVFDFSRLAEVRMCAKQIDRTRDGPSDLFCVRISFAKGWGANFSRRYITSCPCWLEIHLNDSLLPA